MYSIQNQLKGLQQEYNPETIVKSIREMRLLDKKICLFMCKRENEELPKEEGCLWVSGDIEVSGIISATRLHIWANFNVEQQLEKFYGLFDKIVIDQSSVKFLGNNFASRFIKLLHPSPDAEFIFENTFNTSYINIEEPCTTEDSVTFPLNFLNKDRVIQDEWFEKMYPQESSQYKELFETYYLNIEQFAIRQKWTKETIYLNFKNWTIQSKFPAEKSSSNPFFEEACLKRQQLLQQYFTSVILVKNKPYPYYTAVRTANDCYFVAKGLLC